MLQLPYAKIQEIVLLPTAISEKIAFVSACIIYIQFSNRSICRKLSQYIEYKSDYIKIVII